MSAKQRLLRIGLPAIAVLAVAGWLGREWLTAKVGGLILESDWRVERLKIPEVVAALEIEPGDRIADIGAGTGIFVWPFARAVAPHGVVYAVDVNRHHLAYVERKAGHLGLTNVRTLLADPDDPLLPEAVDLVFLCDTLHHIQGRQAYWRPWPIISAPEGGSL